MNDGTFYVFYDEKDFVKYCGTAKQLVADRRFKSVNSVYQYVSHIKAGRVKGSVLVLK